MRKWLRRFKRHFFLERRSRKDRVRKKVTGTIEILPEEQARYIAAHYRLSALEVLAKHSQFYTTTGKRSWVSFELWWKRNEYWRFIAVPVARHFFGRIE